MVQAWEHKPWTTNKTHASIHPWTYIKITDVIYILFCQPLSSKHMCQQTCWLNWAATVTLAPSSSQETGVCPPFCWGVGCKQFCQCCFDQGSIYTRDSATMSGWSVGSWCCWVIQSDMGHRLIPSAFLLSYLEHMIHCAHWSHALVLTARKSVQQHKLNC